MLLSLHPVRPLPPPPPPPPSSSSILVCWVLVLPNPRPTDFFAGSTVCPVGTEECTSFNSPVPTTAPTPVCPPASCFPGTSGPCRQASSGVCWPYYLGTTLCPAGTAACYRVPTSGGHRWFFDAEGSQASVHHGSDSYVVFMRSRECSQGTVHVSREPCKGGQSNWRVACLPVVVTLQAAGARVLQGASRVLCTIASNNAIAIQCPLNKPPRESPPARQPTHAWVAYCWLHLLLGLCRVYFPFPTTHHPCQPTVIHPFLSLPRHHLETPCDGAPTSLQRPPTSAPRPPSPLSCQPPCPSLYPMTLS
jgi:hypothetical protein